jgi:hypothetical protein
VFTGFWLEARREETTEKTKAYVGGKFKMDLMGDRDRWGEMDSAGSG